MGLRGRLVFAVIFGWAVAFASWLVAGTRSPLSEELNDSVLNWLLTPLHVLPYLVVIILQPERGYEEFIAIVVVFFEGFVLGLVLYSLFTHFFRKSDVGDVSISDTTRLKE